MSDQDKIEQEMIVICDVLREGINKLCSIYEERIVKVAEEMILYFEEIKEQLPPTDKIESPILFSVEIICDRAIKKAYKYMKE